jgi:HK97 gp10 family phage protein
MTGQWIGLKEANKALKRLPDHVRDKVQKTIDVTAFQMARKAEQHAPRLTGQLRSAIVWRPRPRSLSAIVGIEPDAFYWKYLEYGTVKMKAKPFWRPAAESMEKDHENRMVQALEQALSAVEREAR